MMQRSLIRARTLSINLCAMLTGMGRIHQP
ncbi:Uncharacterised protein [Vibrio cholerae]|nr:Uncharacterised protein [Vibrio cholerae]